MEQITPNQAHNAIKLFVLSTLTAVLNIFLIGFKLIVVTFIILFMSKD
jgi:PhoPQ-activated pathogenicity-related protein